MNPYISLPLTALLLLRSLYRNSLTPLGLLAALITALIHSLHPSSLPFACLCIFFLAGTTATKVHHAKKAHLTLSSSGSQAGEGPRTHVQVLANSACASLLILVHVWRDGVHFSTTTGPVSSTSPVTGTKPQATATAFEAECRGFGTSLLLAGIVSNYAAVAADTLSSELGILSSASPVLITSLRKVPRGTNGGVTLWGLLAGLAGGSLIGLTSVILGTFCPSSTLAGAGTWKVGEKIGWGVTVAVVGLAGSVLDSVLGAVLQATVVDRRTGKVVEGDGGLRVLFSNAVSSAVRGLSTGDGIKQRSNNTGKQQSAETSVQNGRNLSSGRDLLDNNQINLLMAASMTTVGMLVASWQWNVALSSL